MDKPETLTESFSKRCTHKFDFSYNIMTSPFCYCGLIKGLTHGTHVPLLGGGIRALMKIAQLRDG